MPRIAVVRSLVVVAIWSFQAGIAFSQSSMPAKANRADTESHEDRESFAAFLAMVEDDFSSTDTTPDVRDLDLNDPPSANDSGDSDDAGSGAEEALTLADVVASLYRAYPEILQSRELGRIAGGELISAYGSYDTKFSAHSLSEPTGFYENYRNGLGVARQTWWGGYLSAGYRIGRGFYQPWYKERQTDDAGEFKIGVAQPLLQGRAIDAQRVAIFQASLDQQAATPLVQKSILDVSREAISVYWKWVAAGAVLQAQRELLDLAEKRGEQYRVGVQAGKFAEIDLVLNQQLIAERQVLRLKSEQKYRAMSFKLSLYLRDESGQPLVPPDAWLPDRYPSIEVQPDFDFSAEYVAAINRRPEPQILELELRKTQLDRQLACNNMLPRLDFVSEASQDMGPPATKSDDKGEFELVIGFRSEVPIQRRKARGKIQSTSGKMVQISEKLRLTRDKIGTEIQTARNSLVLAEQIVRQSEMSLRAALETLERYRFAFEKGKIDLIYLNLLETKANESEIKLVEAQADWFSALGELQIALGLDPLDQAMLVSSSAEGDVPGPGHLPQARPVNERAFEIDWQRHRTTE
ncbi:MAG: TolC family protein [Planctomycetales bacterium]|nr:TolC family protein [Planctomycetales bacterium]